MGPWDYLKYLAGIKPQERKPLDFTPMPESDFARISDPKQDPKLAGPRYQYDPEYLTTPGKSWTGTMAVPETAGAPDEWHEDFNKLSITPEEVEFLTRSQEKRDAAAREAILPQPKTGISGVIEPYLPMARRIVPAIGGAIAGGMVAGPPGALVGGFAGGFSGSEAAQNEEEMARKRAESDLPQAYGTPAYRALLAQIEGGRQEHNTEASVIEGLINAIPMGTLAETRFIPRVLKEAGRGAALSTAATATLAPFDTAGPVREGGERGAPASLKELGWSGALGAGIGGGFGAFGALAGHGGTPPETPSLGEQFRDLTGRPRNEWEILADALAARREAERPNVRTPKPPFWHKLAWQAGEEPPAAAKDFMGARAAGYPSMADPLNPGPRLEDILKIHDNEQAKNQPTVEPPAASAAPTPPATGTRRAKGPKASGNEQAAWLAERDTAYKTAMANGQFDVASKILEEVDAQKLQWKAQAANAPEGGTIAPQGRVFKPSPGVEEEKAVADLFAAGEGEASAPATPAGSPGAGSPAPTIPSGITDADVDQLIGRGRPTPAAPKPGMVPYEQRIGLSGHPNAPTLNDLRINLAGAAARYGKAVREGDTYTARIEQQAYWAIYDRINNPEAFLPQPPSPGVPTPVTPGVTNPPPSAPGNVTPSVTPRVVAPPPAAPLGGEPVMPKVGLTHDAPKTLGGGAVQPDLPVLSPENQQGPPPIYPEDTPELQRILQGENVNLKENRVFEPPTDAELEAAAGVREQRRLKSDPAYADLVALLEEQNARMREAGVFEPSPPAEAPKKPGFVYESATEPQSGYVQPPLKPVEGAGAAPPAAPMPRPPAPAPPPEAAPDAVRTASGGVIPVKPPTPEAPAPQVAPTQPSWKAKPIAPVEREGAIRELTPLEGERERIAILDPRVIGVDAPTFQFKESDAEGWTGALQGAKEWAKDKTGKPDTPPILVFRKADGSLWVADGHQRLALYKRLFKDGKQLPPLIAEVISETDGWTIPEVRRFASMRNIRQGSATVVDIAKLIRSGGDLTEFESAPMPTGSVSGAKLRQGQELAKLGDEAFQAVVNQEVKPEYAVFVPKYLTDPDAQRAVVKTLGMSDIKTQEQAEALVLSIRNRMLQAQENAAQIDMLDLFGSGSDKSIREGIDAQASLIRSVQSELNTQKGLFGQLLKNAERAEAAGNLLKTETNQAISEETKTLLFHWEKYRDAYGSHTNRALNQLSGEMVDGTVSKAVATQRVLDALRRDIETGGTAAGSAPAAPANVTFAGKPADSGGTPAVQPAVGGVGEKPPAAPVEAKPPEPVPDATQQDIFAEPTPPTPKPQNVEEVVRTPENAPSAATPATVSSTSSPVPPPVEKPTPQPKPQSVNEMFPRQFKDAPKDEYARMLAAKQAATDAASQRGMRDRILDADQAAKDLYSDEGVEGVVNYWQELQAEIEQSPITTPHEAGWIKGAGGEYTEVPNKGFVAVRFDGVPSAEVRAILKAPRASDGKPMFRYDRRDNHWYGDILGHKNNADPRTGKPKGTPQDDLIAAVKRALGLDETIAPSGETTPPVAETTAPIPETTPPAAEPPLSAPVDVKTKIGIEPTLPGMAEGVGAPPAKAKPLAEVPFALSQETGPGEPIQPELPGTVEKPKFASMTAKAQTVEDIVGQVKPKTAAPKEPPLPPFVEQHLEMMRRAARGEEVDVSQFPDFAKREIERIAAVRATVERGRKFAREFERTHQVKLSEAQIQQAVALRHQAANYIDMLTERVPNKPDVPASLTPAEKAAGVEPGVPQRTSAQQIFRAPEGFPSRVPESVERRAERALSAGDLDAYAARLAEISDITYSKDIRNQSKTPIPKDAEGNPQYVQRTPEGGFKLYGTMLPIDLQGMYEKNPRAFWNLIGGLGGGVLGWGADDEDRARGFIRGVMGGLAVSSLTSPNVRAEAARLAKAVGKFNSTASELKGKVALRALPDPNKDMSKWSMYRPGFFEKNAPEAFNRYLKVMDEYNYKAHYGGLSEAPQNVQMHEAKTAIRRVVEELRGYAKEIEKEQPIRAAYVREGADALAKKPTNLQRAVKETMSPLKEVDNAFFERNVGANIYRVLTGYAVSTALQNLTQPILALRHVQLKDLAWAYSVARSDWAKSITKHIDIHRPMDLAEEAGIVISKPGKPEPTGAKKYAVDPHAMLMESDKFNRRVVYLAAMKQADRRGLMGPYADKWAQAVQDKTFVDAFRSEADQWARAVMRETQGEVGPLGFNPVWRGPIGGSIKPFMKFPTLLTENLIHTFTQPDKDGRNRFVLAVMALTAAGKFMGLDFEDMLLMGGRPMGIDLTDPKKTAENWISGKQFPVVRAAADLQKHWTGQATHKLVPTHLDELLDSDLPYLTAGRYPTQLAQGMQRTWIHDIKPSMQGEERTLHMKRTPSGAPNPVTAGEELANLLGFKSTRQTNRADLFEEMGKLSSEDNANERAYSQEMGRRIRWALDNKDQELLGQLVAEYNAHKRNSRAGSAVIKAATKDRYGRVYSGSSKEIQRQMDQQFREPIANTAPER